MEPLMILVGQWTMTGRSYDAVEENVRGTLVARAVLNGHMLELASSLTVNGLEFEALELIWPDRRTGDFAAHVYSPEAAPLEYRWARVDDATLLHQGLGATYLGTITDDGDTLTGAWTPDPGQPKHAGSAYSAVMRRIK